MVMPQRLTIVHRIFTVYQIKIAFKVMNCATQMVICAAGNGVGRMKIVIVGDGKVGYALTKILSQEGHDITVIDSNPQVLQQSVERLDVMVVHGNGASLEVQQEAGVAGSDLLIAATSGDEINLLCCILARKLGCCHTIARVRNPDYTNQLQFLREELGLSMTINPERAAAQEIFHLLQFPSFLKRDSFAKGRIELVELKIKEESPLAGCRLDRLQDVIKARVLICAVEREGNVTIPTGSFVLQVGDKITVTAASWDLAKLIKSLKINTQKVHNVMIIGGSHIAAYLTENLLAIGVGVKIIEERPQRCAELSEILPDALIINGNGSSQELLLAEGLEETDAIITLTGIDEENLIISMYADHVGVPKSITKINRLEYASIFKEKGLGSVVSPKLITANHIVRYVRAMENTTGSAVITLHRIVDNKAEALEFIVSDGAQGLRIPLHQLRLRPNLLIACINRNGKVILPSGNDYIQEGDTVVVVTTSNQSIYDFNDIFREES